jgi:hypothetical protein
MANSTTRLYVIFNYLFIVLLQFAKFTNDYFKSARLGTNPLDILYQKFTKSAQCSLAFNRSR